jgi:NADPH:quinone reductase-like Zn-dependent oxidoreductase
MKYKQILVPQRGGPEVMEIVDADLRPPAGGEVRVRVQATPVVRPDVQARYGQSPFAPKLPFVPGYTIVGIVDAVGSRVSRVAPGEQVGAHTVLGGYAEYIYLREKELIPVPGDLDPAEAVVLILNYLVAYQTLHRSAKVKDGDRVLIIGASGGIGTAFLQLGKLAGLGMYGLASSSKHAILYEYGATPIDYNTQDFVEVIHRCEPGGLDAVFDGMAGDYLQRGYSLLKRGGVFVEYGNPLSMTGTLSMLGQVIRFNLSPDGKRAAVYGTGLSKFHRRPFTEDWAKLFSLLEAGRIKPVIASRFPLLDAARANELLESGQVTGNIVLLAPELLKD